MTQPGPQHTSVAPAFQAATDRPKAQEKARVLSIRLTPEERTKLERAAAGAPLSTFARNVLLGDGSTKRRSTARHPIKDHEALGRALAALGRSTQVGTLKGVLRAVDEGGVVLSIEAETALRETCARIEAVRADLITALGLKGEPGGAR